MSEPAGDFVESRSKLVAETLFEMAKIEETKSESASAREIIEAECKVVAQNLLKATRLT